MWGVRSVSVVVRADRFAGKDIGAVSGVIHQCISVPEDPVSKAVIVRVVEDMVYAVLRFVGGGG